jgi:hypothetical protein
MGAILICYAIALFLGKNMEIVIDLIDISQYRLLFGLFLLYTDRVPFELLDSAALV